MSSPSCAPVSSSTAPVPTVPELSAEHIKTFVESPLKIPEWKWTPRVWEAADIDRFKDLRITSVPTFPGSKAPADLSVYALGRLEDLDPTFTARFNAFVAGNDHIVLTNTSGSGKTRLVYETIFRRWGIYLTSRVDGVVNPYGSRDLFSALGYMMSSLTHTVPIPPRTDDYRLILEKNQSEVSLRIGLILLSRLIVFDAFMTAVEQAGVSEEEAKAKWFWMQLYPSTCIQEDLFVFLASDLGESSPSEVNQWIKVLLREHESRLSFVAVDEAQVLGETYERTFLNTSHTAHQPILRHIVVSMANHFPHARIIVSGTRIDPVIINEAIAESESLVREVRRFHALGEFRDKERIRNYIEHFLGDGEVRDADLQVIVKWFRGRHRFLATLVAHVLEYGKKRVISVLNALLVAATGFRLTFGTKETKLPAVNIGRILDEDYMNASPLATSLRVAVYNLITQGIPMEMKENVLSFVGSGLAHYGDTIDNALIDEPLIYLNVIKWISHSPSYSTQAVLVCRLRDSGFSTSNYAVPQGLAYSFWKNYHSTGVRLDRIAEFPGDTPRWSKEPAHFMLTSTTDDVRSYTPIDSSELAVPLIYSASDADDVLRWFSCAKSPFLIPDADMGAQLIFLLQIAGDVRVVFVYTDPPSEDLSHRDSTISPAGPDGLYSSNEKMRDELCAVLKTFNTPASPADEGSKREFATLHLHCFVELSDPDHAYEPPVAVLRLEDMIRNRTVKELNAQDVSRLVS